MAGRMAELALGTALIVTGFVAESYTTGYMQERLAVNDELKGRETSESTLTNLGRYAVSDQLTSLYVVFEPIVGGVDATKEQQAVFANTAKGDLAGAVGYLLATALVTTGGLSLTGKIDYSRKVGAVVRA